MPELVFLTERRPLVGKVADWLLEQAGASLPLDLSRCTVILPTAGAARRLGDELLRGAAALLPPRFGTPIRLLDEAVEGSPATPQERQAAWSRVLRDHARLAGRLLPAFPTPLTVGDSLRIGQTLFETCALLAEAGLTPAGLSSRLPQDEERWEILEALYRAYLGELERHGLEDQNELRIRAAAAGRLPPGIDWIVVAGVPDLNGLVRGYLAEIERRGGRVSVLVDAVDCEDAVFDAWGCPEAVSWSEWPLSMTAGDVLVEADAYSEAESAAELVLGGAALCLADEALAPALQSAFARRGREVFNPQGESLAAQEVATLALGWLAFLDSRLVADLRLLMECPAFLRALATRGGTAPSQVLRVFDGITSGTLLDDWGGLLAFARTESADAGAWVVLEIEQWRQLFARLPLAESLPAFLAEIYAGHTVADEAGEAVALREFAEAMREVFAGRNIEPETEQDLLREAVRGRMVYARHDDDAVELNGWLEAPWFRESRVVLTGCIEGSLPGATVGHAFLPDSVRQSLGLATNASRLARDAYLLHHLLAVRPGGGVKLHYGRETASGDPARPSRLLFRCPAGELPARIGHLFREVPTRRHAPARRRGLRLVLDRPPVAPDKLRVTGFGDYLACPMRFYFKHVRRLESVDPAPVEMDARQYGTVFHWIVEQFAKDEEIRESRDPQVIGRYVLDRLDRVIGARHGRRPALPVRVQRESLAARLRQFAQLQALEREKGWRIVDAEHAFRVEDTLRLAGLPITASLDRVEIHEATGRRRVLDYKTFARDKSPADTHLGARGGDPLLPGEEVFWQGKPRFWKNLQLPLYRALAEYRWPGGEPPVTGYFLLPERTEDSRVEEFELDDFTFRAALECAEAIAERVRRGVFWPPREVEFDDFTSLFLDEDPADVLSPESVEFLRGEAS